MVLLGHVTNQILYIFTYTKPIVIKHGEVVVYREGLLPINSSNPLNMQLRDKLKTYPHCQNAYGHQTCQGGDIVRGASTRKFTRSLN